ncbi:MAG: hypothetical protein AB7F98_01840 [Novosphingobium sp.]
MAGKRYRVVQWATGVVGQAALRHFIENPVFELAGVLVYSPDKVGMDAGELVGLPPTGVLATDDFDQIMALDADCVVFAPIRHDWETVCRLLRSGKNVISPLGPFYPTERYQNQFAELEAACQEGGVSIYGGGVHPGFAGDILPLTLARLMNRIDRIEVAEIIDKQQNPMVYIEVMGFGTDPDELLAKPRRSTEAPHFFAQSMAMVIEGLGKKIEKLTTDFQVARATQDIPYTLGEGIAGGGVIRKGTVGGQQYEWTAWVDGAPFMTYRTLWTMGEHIEPRWDTSESCYRIVIDGDPPLEMKLLGGVEADGRRRFHGLPWTGLLSATAVPAVCEARPGLLTHLDLGIVKPQGLVRR